MHISFKSVTRKDETAGYAVKLEILTIQPSPGRWKGLKSPKYNVLTETGASWVYSPHVGNEQA